jgi:hypothetical protein
VRVGTNVPVSRSGHAWSRLGVYRTITALIGRSDSGDGFPAASCGSSPHTTPRRSRAPRGLSLARLRRAVSRGGAIGSSQQRVPQLQRIEEIAGVQLRVGDDRLKPHLGLRMWSSAGSPTAERLKR